MNILRITWKVLRRIFLLLTILLLIPVVLFFADYFSHGVRNIFLSDTKKWMEDIEAFEQGLLQKHINPSHLKADAPVRIQNRLDSLKKLVVENDGKMDKDIMRVEFMKTSALLDDGHTRITNYNEDVGLFPFRTSWFSDGLYVVSVDSGFENLLGNKIDAINGISFNQVLEKIKSISPGATEGGKKLYTQTYIYKPGLLYGLGISEYRDRATFTFSKNDTSFTQTLYSQPDKDGAVLLETIKENTPPLYRKNRDKPYWFEYDETRKLIYFNYNSVRNDASEPFSTFIDRLMRFSDSVAVDKFIIDIRENRGGNNFLTIKLVSEISKRAKLNKNGVLYCITGYGTFSAAICFAANLASKTEVTFMGSEMGDTNNLPGDPRFVKMRQSGFTWFVSDLYWENSFYGDASAIQPVHNYMLSIEEFESGKSPIVDFIATHNPVDSTLQNSFNHLTSYSGRYLFSPDKTLELVIDDSTAHMSISGYIHSRLKYVNDSTLQASNLGLSFILTDNRLYTSNLQSIREIQRLKTDQFTALELLLSSRFSEAHAAYLQLEREQPELAAITGNNLATMANYILAVDEDHKKRYELLKTALALDPESSPVLGQFSNACGQRGEKVKWIFYGAKAIYQFDWRYIMDYGKVFGFI